MGPDDIMPMTGEDRKKAVETFLEEYFTTYRDYLGAKDIDERHLPSIYKGFPFITEAYLHPNLAVTVVLKKSNRSRILVVDGEFEEVRNMIREKSFDYLQVFPPYTQWTTDEAERISKSDADRDLAESRRLELLSGIEGHIKDIKTEVDNIVKLNPWLDEQSKAQAEKMEKARELITELYRELETDKNERFSRYDRELMEIEAFEGVKIETIASEMEVEVESAVGEMEEQFGDIEEKVKEMEKEFEDFREGVNASLDDYRKHLENFKNMEMRLVEAVTEVENLEAKIDKLDSSDELVDDIKDLRDSGRKLNTKMKKAQNEIRLLKKESVVTEEIKDTVFRDSKRIHNINERMTDIENQVKKMDAGKTKKSEDEIKALKKRFDNLDKDLSKMVEKAVVYELELREPVMEDIQSTSPPKGATVKKTTRKKTTKKKSKK